MSQQTIPRDEVEAIVKEALRAERIRLAQHVSVLTHHCFWLSAWGYTKPDTDSAQALVTDTINRVESLILRENRRQDFLAKHPEMAEKCK